MADMTTAVPVPAVPTTTETAVLWHLLRRAGVPDDVLAAGGPDGQHITNMIFADDATWADVRRMIRVGYDVAAIADRYAVTDAPDDYPTWNLARRSRIPSTWPSRIVAAVGDDVVAHVPATHGRGRGRWVTLCGIDADDVPTGPALALCVPCHGHIAGVIVA